MAVIFIFIIKPGHAQEYHRFRFGIGFGNSDFNGISVRYFEPSYQIGKNIALGLQFESRIKPHIEECISYTLNGQYYFTDKYVMRNKPRFFVGLGFGIFSAANRDTAIRVTSNGVLYSFKQGVDGARAGFYPRVGFELNRFTFTLEYNFIYRQHIHTTYFLQTPTQLQTWVTPYTYVSDNYSSFKIGYFFGGGQKKQTQIVEYDKQNFKKIRLGFGLGYAGLHRDNGTSVFDGLILFIEPSYRLRNNILIGARLEEGINSTYDIKSFGFLGQYYFSNRKLRPFAGFGLSLFHSSFSINNYLNAYNNYYSSDEETVLGFYPRIGIDIGHLSITMDWNIAASAKVTINNLDILNGSSQSYIGYINNNYLSIKAGMFIGGGRKKIVTTQK